jgi:hypothetical protein
LKKTNGELITTSITNEKTERNPFQSIMKLVKIGLPANPLNPVTLMRMDDM